MLNSILLDGLALAGAGIGAGVYSSAKEAFSNFKPLKLIEPSQSNLYNELYSNWKSTLNI